MAYTKAELDKKSLPELKVIADQAGLDYSAKATKSDLKIKLLSVEEPDDELDDDEYDDSGAPANDESGLDDDELDDDEAPADDEEDDDLELPEPDETDEVDDEVDDVDEAPKKPAKKTAATKRTEANPDNLAAKQVATILGTEAKTLRQFFRSPASTTEPVGSGGRYEFAKTDLDKIKEEFTAWQSAHKARGSKRGPAGKKSEAPAAEEIAEVDEIEELDDAELDDELEEDDLELDE